MTTNNQLIKFTLGEQMFSLELSSVYSILGAESLQLENGPNDQIGWLVAKPKPIIVYSLAKRFMQKQTTIGPIIVLNSPEHKQAFMLKEILGIASREQTKFHNLPKTLSNSTNKFFNGILEINNDLFLNIDPTSIMAQNTEIVEELSGNNDLPKTDFTHLQNLSNPNIWANSKKQIFLSTTGLYTEDKKQILMGLSITQVCEIIETTKINPIPCASKHIMGFILYHNQPVVVIDIGYCLTKTSTELNTVNKLVVVRGLKVGELVAFPVGNKVSVYNLPILHKACKTNSLLNNKFILAAFEIEKSLLIIPNIE
ncbi:MAG: chemotaxis protein CheW [Acidobacteria bacterium]|nr:chemotaxis protein CheW [Acidobacteriota bacterium]